MIEWMIADRQEGKTRHLIEWLLEGNAVNYFPGWDRIILVSSRFEVDTLRNDPQISHTQVFTVDEWIEVLGRKGTGPLKIAIDNVDYILNRMFSFATGTIVKATANGKVGNE